MKHALRLVLLAALLAAGVGAQTFSVVGAPGPVHIGLPPANSPAGGPFTFSIDNAGEKPIAAVIVAVSFLDAAGRGVNGPTQIETKSLLPQEPGLAPGEGMQVKVGRGFQIGPKGQGRAPAKAQFSVDYVLYMDGATWGPNTRHEAITLAGMRNGARIERERLATLLKEKGPAALAAALAQH